MRRTSRSRAWETAAGRQSGLAGTIRYFNHLSAVLAGMARSLAWALALALAISGPVWADVSPHHGLDAAVLEPDLHLDPPDGHCLLDTAARPERRFDTGFEPGLRSGTVLMALYVPCVSLQSAEDGDADWLPEWVAIEKNTVTYPSDDARRLGPHGAVRQLCADAQSSQWGHLRSANSDVNARVVEASTRLSLEKPVVFLGVIGEDDHACYLAALQLVMTPSGGLARFLVVQAFMQAGNRWVTQSVRREVPDTIEADSGTTPADIFAASRKAAQTFADKNH